ncbi:integrase [Chryseobacterium sp. 7]|uniref:tyrosine-type recombinase/integrase n=1 Tax=Chryseobacterium sp. 7 TaxID=2035214 RepID=UPI000EB0FB95|nr:site-specific integrase [Chryseobacterium sp. 7]RLJ31359.1 integrase [Chryseobacterium sp. 7]
MKSYSEMKVYPVNWETSKKTISKDWIVRYNFTDKNGIEYPTSFKGMNHIKDHTERVAETRRLIAEEQYLLDRGYNPKTGEYDTVSGLNLVNGKTLFLAACNIAIETKDLVKSSKEDMINSMKHITKYATLLKLHLKPIKDITKADIKQLLIHMKNDQHTNYRINKTKSHLSSCFTFFTELDIFQVNFVRGISKLPHIPAKKEVIRTPEEWKKFHSIKNLNYNVYVFLYIFFYCGSRFEEMIHVKKEDVEIDKSIFWINLKKGGVHTRAMRPINFHAWNYWKTLYDIAKPDQYLFSFNQMPHDEPVTANSLYRIASRYLRKVGLNITGYALKHSYINMVTNVYGLSKGKELAGHTTERTTLNYAVDYEQQQVEKNKNIDICI